jgi:hypothetical protein
MSALRFGEAAVQPSEVELNENMVAKILVSIEQSDSTDLDVAMENLDLVNTHRPGLVAAETARQLLVGRLIALIEENWGPLDEWVGHMHEPESLERAMRVADRYIPILHRYGAPNFILWSFRVLTLGMNGDTKAWEDVQTHLRAHPFDPDVYRVMLILIGLFERIRFLREGGSVDLGETAPLIGSVLLRAEENIFASDELRFHRGEKLAKMGERIERTLQQGKNQRLLKFRRLARAMANAKKKL